MPVCVSNFPALVGLRIQVTPAAGPAPALTTLPPAPAEDGGGGGDAGCGTAAEVDGTPATIATNCWDSPAFRSTFGGTITMGSGVREIVALAESVAVVPTIATVCALETTGGATYVAEFVWAPALGGKGDRLPILGFRLQLTAMGCPVASVASNVAACPDVSKTVCGLMFTLYPIGRQLPTSG